MRWRRPEQSSTRIRTRFLLFPLTIRGQTRWLEKATWEEKVIYYGAGYSCTAWAWEPQCWFDV
jgi:hypothetical protein